MVAAARQPPFPFPDLPSQNAIKLSHFSRRGGCHNFVIQRAQAGASQSASRRAKRETKPKSENTIYDVFDKSEAQYIVFTPLTFPIFCGTFILLRLAGAPFGPKQITIH